jgi:hypothetical protein
MAATCKALLLSSWIFGAGQIALSPLEPVRAEGIAHLRGARARQLRARPHPVTESPPEADAPKHWYGWQILIADATTIGLTATARSLDGNAERALSLLAGVAYWVPSPVLHAEHDQAGNGVISLGLRLALPFFGALAGIALGNDCTFHVGSCYGLAWGFYAGTGSAMLLDAAWLAREPVRHAEARADEAGTGVGLQLTPVLAIERTAASIGVAAAF